MTDSLDGREYHKREHSPKNDHIWKPLPKKCKSKPLYKLNVMVPKKITARVDPGPNLTIITGIPLEELQIQTVQLI